MEGSKTERLNKALSVLRNDLIEMRNQDIHLMKQLLSINNAIRQITSERICRSVRGRKMKTGHSPMRQLSLPPYVLHDRQIFNSTSSTEEYSEDTSDWSETEDELFSKSVSCVNYHSVPSIHPLLDYDNDDSSDEEVLKTNIKLWKYTNGEDSSNF